MKENFNPVLAKMDGNSLRGVIKRENRETLDGRAARAMLKAENIMSRTNGDAIKKIAEDLLRRHPLSAIERMSEESLSREIDKFGTAEELLGICQYLVKKQEETENAKWAKYQ